MLELDPDVGSSGMLGRVLQSFQAAEIDGGLNLGIVATYSAGGDGGMGAKRRHQSQLMQYRRINVPGKVAQRVEGCADLPL